MSRPPRRPERQVGSLSYGSKDTRGEGRVPLGGPFGALMQTIMKSKGIKERPEREFKVRPRGTRGPKDKGGDRKGKKFSRFLSRLNKAKRRRRRR